MDAHRLRARSCAMLTGLGTVRRDDAALTVRAVETSRQPYRLVVDNRLETPLGAKVLQGAGAVLLTVCTDEARARSYRDRGVDIAVLPAASNGRVDFRAMALHLGQRAFNEVTVEAGSRLLGPLLEAGVIDEFVFYVAPSLLGEGAAGVVQLVPLTSLSARVELAVDSVSPVGRDWRIVARTAVGQGV